MAAVELEVDILSHTEVADLAAQPGEAADAEGNLIPNNGSVYVIATNTDSSDHTVSIAVEQKVDGLAVEPREFTVPASSAVIFKLGSPKIYGKSTLVTADSTSVKLYAFR